MAKSYTAKDITVLEGLEPVRKRPAMYIGGVGKDGYHHLLAEILDNSIDEAMNGYASTVWVRLSADRRSVTVRDDGRGIPVDMHPKMGKRAVTVILTTLHAGGKFEKGNYAHSGGLHGVGASVVNALSERLEVRVVRDGALWVQTFSRGKESSKVEKRKTSEKKTGTTITFTPDPQIFGTRLRFDPERIRRDLDDRSFVHKGVRFVFHDEASGEERVFQQKEGLSALLERAIGLQKISRVVDGTFVLEEDGLEGPLQRLEVVLTWTDATDERIRSYVNGVLTPSHGTHVNGLRAGVTRAVRAYLDTHRGLVPKSLKIANEDIREGLMAIVSAFMAEPQFQGQTKSRLNNPEVAPAVEALVFRAVEDWLNHHKSIAEGVVARIATAARARAVSREAALAVRKKGKARKKGNLPDKMTDCASNDPEECELFIVEGDSAGGSAKQGRDRKTQAVLPLRGKVLNAEQASLKRVLETRELADIVKALGCGIGESFDLSKLNYHKVILLMDADADGDHITTLLLTFFFRTMPQLIEAGHLYVARPPLFKIELGSEVHWAANEEERDRILAKHRKNRTPKISRFKGLGEMMPQTLAETTLAPGKRTLQRVRIASPFRASKTISDLMGKHSEARYAFIMAEADKLDDIDV